MAQVKNIPILSYEEIINNNNLKLKVNLIPAGYPLWEKSKVHDSKFDKPINLPSYKIEKLTNNLNKNE